MRKTLYASLLLVLLLSVLTPTSIMCVEKEKIAIALGVDEDFSKYVLYSDGSIYRLKEHGKIELIAKINTSLPSNYWYEFFISKSKKLYLYSFNATKITKEHIVGKFILTIVPLNGENKVVKYEKKFEVLNNTLKGELVSAAINAKDNVLLQVFRGKEVRLELYTVKDNITLLKTYSGKYTFTPFKYGDKLLIVSIKKENDNILVPIVVDAVSNKILYTLPSLIPVVELANPVIQLFHFNGKWKVYILVTRGLRGSMETYITEPESTRFFEYPLTYVNPLMHYAIIIHRENNTSTILFKDGYKVNINYTLGLTALGSWLAMDPLNTVLDVDLKNHLVLAKIINGNVSKILVIHNGKQETITTLPAKKAFKEKGLHGVIVDNTVYLVDPDTQKLIVKEIPLEINRPNYMILALIPIILALIIVGYIVFRRFSLSKT